MKSRSTAPRHNWKRGAKWGWTKPDCTGKPVKVAEASR